VVAVVVLASGCGGRGASTRPAADPAVLPIPLGQGSRYRPPSLGVEAARAAPIGGARCQASAARRFGVHLELFAHRRVVRVPAGIGVAPPRQSRGAYVRGGRCRYPLSTTEPTGLIEVAAGARLSLGHFFAIWGQPLSTRRLAGFRAGARQRVAAFVDGERWRGPLGAIPLRRHAQIVLQVGGHVPPHRRYLFPPGR
jgi:hypothetical protein